MKSVLITAFQPYGKWTSNASWLCLMELTKSLPESPRLTTRLYPVDYEQVPLLLSTDLAGRYDFALHLGQSPGASSIRLESLAVNVATNPGEFSEDYRPLAADGPAAYQSELPLGAWSAQLREAGIPASVSFHAGTYLCNATYYWSRHLALQMGLATQSLMVHVPLDLAQSAADPSEVAALPLSTSARAIRLLLAAIEEL